MDTQYLMQGAQETGVDTVEPVSVWGPKLTSAAINFFNGGEAQKANVSLYFREAMAQNDPQNLKMALAAIHSICRGDIYLYDALMDTETLAKLNELIKYPDTLMKDRAAALLSSAMCRRPTKFTVEQAQAIAEYDGSEAGRVDVMANLLKADAWRVALYDRGAMRVLSAVASSSVPVMYKGLMCVWMASYNAGTLKSMNIALVGSINEVLKTVRTEKVIRMALLAVENLLKSKAMCEEMAELETVSLVSALEYEKWRDSELIELIAKLKSSLQAEVKILTNFERFEREVTSGKLKWGFIHSEKFWLENVLKCEANNYRVIDLLMVIARTSRDPETLSVACHDLGEFSRLHPVGKQIATNRGAKDKMLELMSHSQREVAREALLCVQKLMLSKQLDSLQAVASF